MEEFIYLAVVLDAFSRRALGWELGESLETSLGLTALNRALAEPPAHIGIIHNSDQGAHYASEECMNVDRLKEFNLKISMSAKVPLGEWPLGELYQDERGVAEAISRHGLGPPLYRALLGRGLQPPPLASSGSSRRGESDYF